MTSWDIGGDGVVVAEGSVCPDIVNFPFMHITNHWITLTKRFGKLDHGHQPTSATPHESLG